MAAITKTQAWARLRMLPSSLGEAIFAPETQETIAVSVTPHKLDDAATNIIAETIGLVLLGLLPISEFKPTIQREAKLDDAVATSITTGITQRLFDHFREEIRAATRIAIPTGAPVAPRPIPLETQAPKFAVPPPPPTAPRAPIPPQPPRPAAPPPPPAGGPKPAVPTGPGAPPPYMLHKESEAEPVGRAFAFKPDLAQKLPPTEVREPLKPAELELGQRPLPPRPPAAPPPPPLAPKMPTPVPGFAPSPTGGPRPPLRPPLPPYARAEIPKPPAVPPAPRPIPPPPPPPIAPKPPEAKTPPPPPPPQASAAPPAALPVEPPKPKPSQEAIDTEELKKVVRPGE